MDLVEIGCRSLIAVVFLASAAGKLRGRRAYADFVAATRRLVPGTAAAGHRRIAAAVVAVEVLVPPLLAFPATTPAGFALAGSSLAVFTVAILAALRRGERAPCNCFGASSAPLGRGQVYRNLLLGLVVVLGAGAAVSTSTNAAPGAAGTALAGLTGVVLALVVVRGDDIVALFRS
jgi:hypothetical protein